MFEKMSPQELNGNVFSMIGEQWMLVTAGTPERCNTMTASWGGLGVMWGKPVAVCVVRPQRYTRTFLEASDWFTLSFFGPEYRKALSLCGSKSGREVDKIKECSFTPVGTKGGSVCFEQAELVLVCRKLYRQDMDPTCFVDAEPDQKWYPEKDYHRMYVGEIEEVLKAVK